MKKYIISLVFLIFLVFLGTFARNYLPASLGGHGDKGAPQVVKAEEDAVEKIITSRQEEREKTTTSTDATNIFDKNGIVRVLLIGLDKRVGQTQGHCDVIQLISIDQKMNTITLTAVPRGTYSSLPPGKASTSTDYYVSNACGLGGLEYGITQIEKILGQKADYLVVVGFSETLGILRMLDLPTTETLQWLRRRHVYAIGEPQRAHNHSTFIKELVTRYIPKETSQLDTALRYLVYKIVQTDLTFDQAQIITESIAKMDLTTYPERVQLTMRPAYPVQEIVYDPEHLDIKPGVDTVESIQKKLLDMIEQRKNDKEFVAWAFDNDLWLQVEDDQKRESIRYDLMERYIKNLEDTEKKEEILADYVLEMQHLEKSDWMNKGKELLATEVKK